MPPDGEDRITDVSKNADGSGTLTFASGKTLAFTAVKSMTATAYTKGYGGADSTTATGTTVHVGVVAVDKKVIPLGTRMYIVSEDGSIVYGMAAAEDTGVRGDVVDLYYDTYDQCIEFGRRKATVYILS
jgi:3D (Asp-Asp-Asp) domain-containing protein